MTIGVLPRPTLALGAVLAALALVAQPASAGGSRVPLPTISVDRSTQCVAPADVMRRTHMEMLQHRRDRTVHQGVRGGDESLNRCLSCHADKTTGAAVGTRDAFCQSCHDYVGVKLDCFECHQGRPGAQANARETKQNAHGRSEALASPVGAPPAGRGGQR